MRTQMSSTTTAPLPRSKTSRMDTDMTIKERVKLTKLESSPALAASTEAQRNAALALIADRLYENREVPAVTNLFNN